MTEPQQATRVDPPRFPIEITRRIVDRIRGGSLDTADRPMSEPASVFTDPVQFEREKTAFFQRGAHVVGWEGEVAEPNSFTTKDVAGMSLLITRDGNGELHAFRNVCTHRGAQVATGCGVTRRLTCPYHAWSFDTGGRLAGQPDSWAFEGIDRETLGLMPLPLASVHGLLVVGLTSDVDPAAELASIAAQLEGYSYATHEVICQHHWTVRANWKIAVDVNLEGYHIAALHRETLANLVVNHAIHDTFGRHARWGFPTRAAMAMVDLPEASWPEPAPLTVVHTFFPSCVVLETPVSSQMFRIYPGRHVGESTVELTEASIRPVQSEDEREARKKGAEFAELVVGQEDFPVAEQCQRGAESGLTQFVFGTVEPMLQHWHTTWREALESSS